MCFWPMEIATGVKVKNRKRLVYNSGKTRFDCVKFFCNFCGKIRWNQSYSVVDGGRSCIKCDEIYFGKELKNESIN